MILYVLRVTTYNNLYNNDCEYRMDAELHIVHVNQEGRFAVVGVLFKLGRSDPIISKVSI